jgi:glycerate kinase
MAIFTDMAGIPNIGPCRSVRPYFINIARSFDAMIAGADLVVTGEGKVDFQTAKGKTAAGVLARAKRVGIPVVAIGGCVEMCDSLEQMGFAGIYPILEEKVPLEIAMEHDFASANVTRTITRVLSQMKK